MSSGGLVQFTSSGDIGGGRQFTKFKGPLLMGVTVSVAGSSGTPVDTWGSTGNQGGGTATAPMYSFWNRPDSGLYLFNNTSSAGDVRMSALGTDLFSVQTSQLLLTSGLTSVAVPVLTFLSDTGTGIGHSAAGQFEVYVSGGRTLLLTSAVSAVVIPGGGFASTAGNSNTLGITQTTGAMAGSTAGPVALSNAMLSWDSATKTLEVYSTVTGAWMRLHSSSGANITFSSS